MIYPIPETERAINGVNGRAFAVHEPREIRGRRVHLSQTWKAARVKSTSEHVTVEMRFDDSCKNGHQTFSITGETRDSFGCIHDTIVEVFPELAPLIKWHGCSTDGPMHYVANTVYLAGDRDLDAARRAAIWPDATDEQLSAEPAELRASLEARLPALLAEFRAAMESCGFLWDSEA